MKIKKGDAVQFSSGNKTKNGIVSRVENDLAHVVYINRSTKSMFQLGHFHAETLKLTKLEPKAKK